MASQDRESLRNVDGVKVVVEELPPEAAALRLRREDIQRIVDTRLRGAGIRVHTSGHFPPGDPFLRVSVTVTAQQRGIVGYHVIVDFVQLAFLRRDPRFVYNRAQTWKASGEMHLAPAEELAESIQREIIRQVDEYAADYLAVNPQDDA